MHQHPETAYSDLLPTGLFPIDLALGGGIPRNRVTLIHGPPDGLKSTIALKAIAKHQRHWPDLICVLIDTEGSTSQDLRWARALGVDIEKLLIVLPDHTEQLVDVMRRLLRAEDIGLVVLDTLAAMATKSELEKSAEDTAVLGIAGPFNRVMRQLHQLLSTKLMTGDPIVMPTVMLINQERSSLRFDDAPRLPGGMDQIQISTLIIRIWSKGLMDEHISDRVDARRLLKGTIRKHKQPIFSRSFELEIAMQPQYGFKVGESVSDWAVIKHFLAEYGLASKTSKPGVVVYEGKEFATQKSLWDYLHEGDRLEELIRLLLIAKAARHIASL